MKKPIPYCFLIVLLGFMWFHPNAADGKSFYRTFEIIGITEDGLRLKDGDGNVIEVDKAPEGYKVGYKVRYDSVRNRLRSYRWQEYTVSAISGSVLTLTHATGDVITVEDRNFRQYKIGDAVRYDSVGEKLLHHDKDEGEWMQYTVVRAARDRIVLKDRTGGQLTLYMDNNVYEQQRGLFIAKYQVGDEVRYNAAANQLRKDRIRTYDWKDYRVVEVAEQKLTLTDEDNRELVLKNSYGSDFEVGDRVKYDRLNDLLKKTR